MELMTRLAGSLSHWQLVAPRCAGPPATSSAPRTTQQRKIAKAGTSTSLREKERPCQNIWWCTKQVMTWPRADGCHQLMDVGGDATLLGGRWMRTNGSIQTCVAKKIRVLSVLGTRL